MLIFKLMNELKLLVSTNRLDAIAITKTNPNQSAFKVDSFFSINAYNGFRNTSETVRGIIILKII